MIIFRPHRMGADIGETMAEAQIFTDKAAMIAHLVEGHCGLFEAEDISFGEPSPDTREGVQWEDSTYVLTRRLGEQVYDTPQCIGMCATKFKGFGGATVPVQPTP